MDIEELKEVLKDLREAQDRFKAAVKKSELSGVYTDQFEEKMSELAHVVGDAIGVQTVALYF